MVIADEEGTATRSRNSTAERPNIWAKTISFVTIDLSQSVWDDSFVNPGQLTLSATTGHTARPGWHIGGPMCGFRDNVAPHA